jgi:orotate phosphoribosyltransferase
MANSYSIDDLINVYTRMGVVHVNRQTGFVVRGMRISPFYVDGMRIATSVDGLRIVTELMSQRLEAATFDAIGAPSISGIPYASVLASRFEKRLIIDRGLPSKHGLHRRIEGEVRAGDRVVIVDDIAKRGQTLLEMCAEFRAMGAVTVKALVTVDATSVQEKALLEGAHIKLESLLTLDSIGVNRDLQMDQATQP